MTDNHIEGGDCWCDRGGTYREDALDRLYPDRCQHAESPAAPTGVSVPEGQYRHCVRVAGHLEPCRRSLERPGDPCHWCGTPTKLHSDGPGCSLCWIDLTTMALADQKALFAEYLPELSLDPVIRP